LRKAKDLDFDIAVPLNPDYEGLDWENIETYNRQFVSDLPWYHRFIIWLFPRMFDLEDYP
jgi:hypothetical protein